MGKPKIFIGSSTEGLDLAHSIQQNLDHFAEVTIWSQGVSQLSTPVITSLINALGKFDFAIFVFSADDISTLRGKNYSSVRDNVIFETGLFLGRIGADRVFFIKPRNQENLHLPTDLLGTVAGEFDANRSDGNLSAATAPFCNQVRQKIKELGIVSSEKTESVKSYENDMRILRAYMRDKNYEMMSISSIQQRIHPKFTEEHLLKLIEAFPSEIRRCTIKDSKGIKLLPQP